MLVFFKLKPYGISGLLGLILSFFSNKQLQVALNEKPSQEYPVNTGVPQGSVVGPTLFLLCVNDFPNDVIHNIDIYADDTTLYFMLDQVFDLWQQLELASELESDLREAVYWGRKQLVDFNAEKSQHFLFDWSDITDAIDLKMMGLYY